MIKISKAHCKIPEKIWSCYILTSQSHSFYFVEKVALKKFKTMFAHACVPWSALVRVLQGERLRKLCFGECKSKLNLILHDRSRAVCIQNSRFSWNKLCFFFLAFIFLAKVFCKVIKKSYDIRGQVGPTESENEQPIFPLLARIA